MDDMNNLNQTPQQMPTYGQPEVEPVITVGDWALTILLTWIPCVNIIMLCIWAFGSSTPRTKSNWAKAMLIFVAISVVLSIIFSSVLGASLAAVFGG
ncbi:MULTISPECIES: hypothetical protein [unclassified Butyrivibrio]|uniref:hypothetical protein n=1 Tax=unclassified Butyrivibrio TaxID=2639466 RepID=UPI0003B61B73|nr:MULTISPECIES: hypothetical protein [unclassified Butyrivibrio]